MSNYSDEFGLITRYFGNVGSSDEQSSGSSVISLGVGDDCAILRTPPGYEMCLSIDTLVCGVHFPETVTPYNLGYRCLAVSLSDLAAMGAQPVAFTLALTLPENNCEWLDEFSRGLSTLANEFNVRLVGGDTTKGPLTISIQVHGIVPEGQAIKRSGARPGDLICVSGALGDAGAALNYLHLEPVIDTASAKVKRFLSRYFFPQPRTELGCALRGLATAAIDISDGLLADLNHILVASDVGALLYEEGIPCSRELISEYGSHSLSLALTAGDDYELCFCLAESDYENLQCEPWFASVSVVGVVTDEPGIKIENKGGDRRVLPPDGYKHF